MTKLAFIMTLILLMAGCSVGKGYVFEPTGITKCVVASAEEGEVSVDTPMSLYGSLHMKGTGITYHSMHKDYCDVPDHTSKDQ